MDETTNLLLPYILAAQAQKHVTHNEALRKLDALIQLAVIDRDATAPPATPAEGDRYLLPASPTGAWAGHGHKIAAYQDGAWTFFSPNEGWLAWVADEDIAVVWDGATWATFSGGGGGVSLNPATGGLVGVNATADATNRLSVSSPAALFNHEGSGHQLKINKAAASNTASVLFQTGFSGRAEFGTTGDDDWHVKVSPNGSTWHEALVADRSTGAISVQRLGFHGVLTPATITANQNDYNPTGLATAGILRLASDASRDITGLATGVAGRVIVIHNVGSFPIVLQNDSSASTAANRFVLGDARLTLNPGTSLVLVYDGSSSRWRLMARSEPNPLNVFNLFDDAGRFAGSPEVQGTTIGSYVAPAYISVYNGSTLAAGPKFITNNTTYGGTAGALDSSVNDLVTKIKAADSRRHGVEYFLINGTAGTGTANSITIGATTYYLTVTNPQAPLAATYTIRYMVRCLTGGLAIRKQSTDRLFIDFEERSGATAIPPADGWRQVTLQGRHDPMSFANYDTSFKRLYATPSATYQIAMPLLYPGHYDVAAAGYLGVVPSLRAWR